MFAVCLVCLDGAKLRKISGFERNAGEMARVLQSGRPSQPGRHSRLNKRQQLVKTRSSHFWDSVHNVLQFQASVLEFVPLLCFGFVAAGGEIGFYPIRKSENSLFFRSRM